MRLFAVITLIVCSTSYAETLRILNWSDYIDEEFLKSFQAETQIDIEYVTYEDIDEFEFKYILSEDHYDIVFPPIDSLQTMIERNMLMPLDRQLLPNADIIDPTFFEQVSDYDPGNRYALPYLWGTTGIGLNVGKVTEALGSNADLDSWELLFDQTKAEQLQYCGISWLDSEIEMLPLSLNYIGEGASSTSRTSFRAARDHLETVSSTVRQFTSEEYLEPFRDGELCAVIGYSGDIYQAIWEAEELENGQELSYVIPKEGTFIWFDPVVISSKANKAVAHLFLNTMLEPKNIAAITNYVWYANPVPSSLEFVDNDIKNDPSIYPNRETAEKLFGYPVYEDSVLRTMTRRWTQVKCAAGLECLAPVEAIPTK